MMRELADREPPVLEIQWVGSHRRVTAESLDALKPILRLRPGPERDEALAKLSLRYLGSGPDVIDQAHARVDAMNAPEAEKGRIHARLEQLRKLAEPEAG